MNSNFSRASLAALLLSLGILHSHAAAQEPPPQTQPAEPAATSPATVPAANTTPAATAPQTPASVNAPSPEVPAAPAIASPPLSETQLRMRNLLQLIDDLQSQLKSLRVQLAQEQLGKTQAQRELDDLRQFIADHREFGQDFEKYKAIRDIAERQDQERKAEQIRQRREDERAQREARRQAIAMDRAKSQAEADRISTYRRAGFSPLGLDVFASRMSFYYETREVTPNRIAYDPLIGHYTKTYPPYSKVDYSSMTISGSIVNGSDETRDIGVAITFFDENGKQVGNETVKINNARPNVPYPFTSKISMALDRPFDSSSIYVLYADPSGENEPASAPAASPSPSGRM